MLTQTLRQMERDGLLTRTIYAVVPPKVEYKLIELGLTLSGAFCGVWVWAAGNLKQVEQARRDFDERAGTLAPPASFAPNIGTAVPPQFRSEMRSMPSQDNSDAASSRASLSPRRRLSA